MGKSPAVGATLSEKIVYALTMANNATTEKENDFWYGVYYRLTVRRG